MILRFSLFPLFSQTQNRESLHLEQRSSNTGGSALMSQSHFNTFFLIEIPIEPDEP